MPFRDPGVSLRQMLDHAREAVSLVQGRKRTDLDTDRTFNLSLVRLLEIVGEAARRVPLEIRERHGAIPWLEVVGFRSRLIHDYDEVDFNILWQVVTRDLPLLVGELEKIVPPSSST